MFGLDQCFKTPASISVSVLLAFISILELNAVRLQLRLLRIFWRLKDLNEFATGYRCLLIIYYRKLSRSTNIIHFL